MPEKAALHTGLSATRAHGAARMHAAGQLSPRHRHGSAMQIFSGWPHCGCLYFFSRYVDAARHAHQRFMGDGSARRGYQRVLSQSKFTGHGRMPKHAALLVLATLAALSVSLLFPAKKKGSGAVIISSRHFLLPRSASTDNLRYHARRRRSRVAIFEIDSLISRLRAYDALTPGAGRLSVAPLANTRRQRPAQHGHSTPLTSAPHAREVPSRPSAFAIYQGPSLMMMSSALQPPMPTRIEAAVAFT